jgi:hypothetical protein
MFSYPCLNQFQIPTLYHSAPLSVSAALLSQRPHSIKIW